MLPDKRYPDLTIALSPNAVTALGSSDQQASFLLGGFCPLLSLNHPRFGNPAGRDPSSNTAEIPTPGYSPVGAQGVNHHAYLASTICFAGLIADFGRVPNHSPFRNGHPTCRAKNVAAAASNTSLAPLARASPSRGATRCPAASGRGARPVRTTGLVLNCAAAPPVGTVGSLRRGAAAVCEHASWLS